jgi:hypothetical protein
MGNPGARGHDARAQERIARAREHYETRRQRRVVQLWRHPDGDLLLPHEGHVVGAIPEKEVLR